ncbi:alpha/beta hydrolase [Sodalis sp. RH22]|uniref:alpha/beta hydrolase n=1 Tax=unclassified Sodalis (in: enterobacteria) TaxID=2636512 RepID=UPI0039B67696
MNGRKYRNSHQCMTMFSAVFFIILLYAGNSYGKPDMKPLGSNIADRGSSFYHFSVRRFDSADGKRHYKIWTGIPDKSPPTSGFPILYLLDGNAVMDRLSDTLLRKLSEKTPPVIVAIGYQTEFPFEPNARAYDYTPPGKQNSKEHGDSERYGRKGGGSAMFRQLLEDRISLAVEKNIKINPDKRGIWGHSYGGLFVMESYLSSSFFKFYYAASPSLERDDFALLRRLESINKRNFHDKQLYLMEGADAPGKIVQGEVGDALGKVRRTLASLRANGLPAAYWPYPGLTHGEMFNVSFQSALLHIGALREDRPKFCHVHHFSD